MKIAVFEPYVEGIGGAQKVILRYCLYLQEKGHEVVLFTQKYDSKTSYPGFEKLKINLIKPSNKNLAGFAFLKKFKGFDFYIVNDFPSNFISIRNKPVFWLCYSPKRYFYDLKKHYFENADFKGKLLLLLKNLLFKRIDKLSSKKARMIFPVSKTIQKRFKKYYNINAENIFYCGIDFKEYNEGRYEDYILCVSRFEKPKRVDVVINSMGFVKNKKLKLYVVGDGNEKDNLRELSKRYDNVEFLGRISEKRLKNLYSNCLAMVYVPINEDGSLTPLEAGASGKMSLGPNEGALPEFIVKDKTGFLLDKITPQEIAKKIDFIDANRKVAKSMGKNAKAYAKTFDWSNLLPKWEGWMLRELER